MQRWIVVALVAMFAIPMAAAFANPDVFVFTERGNKFKIEEERVNDGSGNNGECQPGWIFALDGNDDPIVDETTGDKICVPGPEVPDPDADEALDSLVSSIYTNSRLTDQERIGKMSYVNGEDSQEQSLYPYMGYGVNDEWASAIYDENTPQIINIPSVYRDYVFVNDGNIHEQDYLDAGLEGRVSKVGVINDVSEIEYYLEDHSIEGNGLVFVKIPKEAEGGIITYDRAAAGKVRLAYFEDNVHRQFNFDDFGNFQNLGMFSHEVNLPAGGSHASHTIEVIRYTGVPSHHFVEGVDFNASVTSIGMNDLHLCNSVGIRYATVPETVEYEQTLPHGFGIFERVGEVFKISRFYEDSGALNYEQSQKASAGIRGQFNALEGDSYNRARTSIEILDGQDPNYEGDLTYCRNGEGNKGKGFMITHPFSQKNTVTISYELTPQVLDSNKNPIGNLTSWLSEIPKIESGQEIFGVTDHTYLVIESDVEESQVRIRYDSRAGYVDAVPYDSSNPITIVADRAFGTAAVSYKDGKMNVTGTGRVIVQLDNSNSEAVANGILTRAELSDDTTFRIVQSPYDLITQSHTERGFNIGHFRHHSGPATINVPAGSVSDSIKSATFTYDRSAVAEAYHGKCCKGKYTDRFDDQQRGSTSNFQISNVDGYYEINRVKISIVPLEWDDWKRHGAKLFRGPVVPTYDNFRYTIYDTLPVKSVGDTLRGDFEENVAMSNEGFAYIIIDSAGGLSMIDNAITPQTSMEITGLSAITNPDGDRPHGIPYYLERDGIGIKSGIVLDRIHVDVDQFQLSVGTGAKLYLYHDALIGSLTGADVLFFDSKNKHAQQVDDPSSAYLYNVHKYVKLPQFTSPTEIVSMKLTSTADEFNEWDEIPMDYLAREYAQFSDVFIPVIPGYQEVHMVIKAAKASEETAPETGNGTDDKTREIRMRLEDVPSDAVIKSFPKQHSTSSEFSNAASFARAETSSTVSFVATESGTASIIVEIPVSGEASFTVSERLDQHRSFNHGKNKCWHNGNFYAAAWCNPYKPPKPPAPSYGQVRADFREKVSDAIQKGQLTNLQVDAHIVINGKPSEVKQLYVPSEVAVTPSHGHKSANTKFVVNEINKVLEFDVKAGDFVEVVIDAKIYAEGHREGRTEIRTSTYRHVYNSDCDCRESKYFPHLKHVKTFITRDLAYSSASVSMGPGLMFVTD